MAQNGKIVAMQRAFIGTLLLCAAPLAAFAVTSQDEDQAFEGDPSAAFDGMGAMAFDLAVEARERMGVSHADSCNDTKDKVSLRLADLRQLVARTLQRVDTLNAAETAITLEQREQALVAELRAVGATNVLISRVGDLQDSYVIAQAAREKAVLNAKRRIAILRQELRAARDVAARRQTIVDRDPLADITAEPSPVPQPKPEPE